MRAVGAILVLTFTPFGTHAAERPNVEKPPIISREAWNADPAIENRQPPIREVDSPTHPVVAENVAAKREAAVYLTVHHSETNPKPGEDPKIRIKRNQKTWQSRTPGNYRIPIERKGRLIGEKTVYMADIPYHFVITPEGNTLEGRELRFAARSNTIYDMPISKHITVVLEGRFEPSKPGAKKPTKAQLKTLTSLLNWLAFQNDIKVNNITYHRLIADSDCPGTNLITEMPRVRNELSLLGVPGDPKALCDNCNPERAKSLARLLGPGNF